MLENWVEIKNYSNYFISDNWRVYDVEKRELVKPAMVNGVLTVVLQEEYATPVTHEVQKLVSEHFPTSDGEFDEREPYVKNTSVSDPTIMVVLSLGELEKWSNSHKISLDAIERVLNGCLDSAMGYEFNYV